DDSQKVAHAFGALVTPDCFLFDSDSVLQYRGRIDDNWKHAADVCCENLKDAIKALLTGMEVPEPETQGIGCSIKWK
ncbi:hypothetical protein CMO92_00320, partial [Candidatus Woesearchaeota archaeon]|nr:hypothetical protein [Candidatus Woesearchaeota archaeon]